MEPYRYHVFICDQKKPEGAPSCLARGAAKVIDVLRAEVVNQGLSDEVQITTCGSLGLCESGPNMVVYPQGLWYCGVTPADVSEIVREHFKHHRPVARFINSDEARLRAEIEENKKKRLAFMKAREAAGVLPDDLNQMLRGFQESRPLLTGIELDIFTAVGNGAAAVQVAEKIECDARATEMLLNALASLEVLEKRDGKFSNTATAQRHFTGQSRLALMHTVHLWPRWSRLTDCVRAGTAVSRDDTSYRGEEWTEAFIAAMHHNASARASQVVGAVGASGVRRMLDIGGGSGAYSIAFAQANPNLHADILDLETVLPITRKHIEEADLAKRIRTIPGDLRSSDYGKNYDLVFISAICHMLGPAENIEMLRHAKGALTAGGRIVIQDFILERDKTSPRNAALFALNMLVGTEKGSSYSEDEYAQWLYAVGFKDVRRIRLPGPAGLMIGTRD